MYHVKKNTLAYHKTRPLFMKMDNSLAFLPDVVAQLNPYVNHVTPKTVVPDNEAVRFYLLNHAFMLLSQKYDENEALPDRAAQIAHMYLSQASEASQRLFFYTLIVITRESRHLIQSESFGKELEKQYGAVYKKFRDALPSGSDAAATYFRNHPPKITLGNYVTAVRHVFNHGKFSGGYGGKPWGDIADAACKLVDGTFSFEAFSDTVWTLAHNNGPMFNKQVLYSMYTKDLYKILDVQRSGQIPQLVSDVCAGRGQIATLSADVKEAWKYCHQEFPEEFGGFVDWFKVEASGSLHKYSAEKKAQSAKHGPSKAEKEAAELEKQKFYVTGTDYVLKVERKKAA